MSTATPIPTHMYVVAVDDKDACVSGSNAKFFVGLRGARGEDTKVGRCIKEAFSRPLFEWNRISGPQKSTRRF